MNRSKILEFFDATTIKDSIHIVGCGAIGSHVCEQLARMGFEEVHIYDFDTVSDHNIANQMFDETQIGMNKCDACMQMMLRINPEMKVHVHYEGLQEPYILTGHVFLCVDNIDLRRTIVEANKYNTMIKSWTDMRMRLTDAQLYFASQDYEVEGLLKTMDFTHDEAVASTPVSACGTTLSVIYAPKAIVCFAISNFVKFLQQTDYITMAVVDMNTMSIEACKMRKKKVKNRLQKLFS